MEEGTGGTAPHAVALGELIKADAVLALAVEVGISGMPRLDRRLDKSVHKRKARPAVADRQRAEFAMELILVAFIGF